MNDNSLHNTTKRYLKGEKMRKRAGRNDHAIFSRTAVKTKRINLPLTNSRGGRRF